MQITDIIRRKKHGETLTAEEIRFFVNGYTLGRIPDYQISSLLMAIWFQGMTKEETSELTMAFVESGDTMDLSGIPGIKVDKHSTGGVGDKISLIVLPVVSALGIPVAKLSGKGLGHTGGTIDKLEAIPGFSTEVALDDFIANVQRIGVALAGQTGDLTPADKKFYALRDVTETVDSIPLIAASIMSKKLASGSDAIVLDVKTGEGAFMKDLASSRQLAQTMVEIGNHLGRRTVAVLTDMNEPLGHEIGNANEVLEAIEILKGKRIPGLWDVAVEISSYMIWLGGAAATQAEARPMVEAVITSGQALAKFKEFIASQGGDPAITEDPSLLPGARHELAIEAQTAGYVTGITATDIGYAAMHLGAGRQTKESVLDYGAGIHLDKLVGDTVAPGEVLCTLRYNDADPTDSVRLAREAYRIGPTPPARESYILDVVTEGDH